MDTVRTGENVVIGEHVSLGKNVVLGNNVIIYGGTVIGSNVVVQDNVIIGKSPAKAKHSILKTEEIHPAKIGDDCTIGTSSIIYANAVLDSGVFVADLATIRERVTVGGNTIIGRGCAVENDCLIGRNCKIETNAYITAYSDLGDYVFVAPCVVTTNDNYMGRSKERFDKISGIIVKDGGRIGANSTILPGITIEEDAAVAAGSIVTKDVQKEKLVAGVPARVMRDVPQEQLLRFQ